MEGLIGEQDDSASLTDGNLAKEPPDSSNDVAEPSEDSRYRWERSQKIVCKNKNHFKDAGSGRSNLPCSFVGEVGSEQFLNEKREESLSSFSALRVGAPAAAEAAAASGIDIF